MEVRANARLGAGLAVAGAFIGSSIAQHLNEQEQKSLAAKQKQVLDGARSGEIQTWTNSDGTKTVDLVPGTTVSKEAALQRRSTRNVNTQQANKLPANAICRDVEVGLHTPKDRISDRGLHCRTAEGDWVRVADVG